MSPGLIALLTDFGQADGYVGVMKGVILGIAPDARLVDITAEIPAHDVIAGAWVLGTSWPHFPDGAIFLCVVDPGVGNERRPIAARCDNHVFVGPDNGLATPMLDAAGEVEAVHLRPDRFAPSALSDTFHGRDLFAPVAAHLARGALLASLGDSVPAGSLIRLAGTKPVWRGDTLVVHVAHVDAFGNLILDVAGTLAERIMADNSVTLRVGVTDTRLKLRAYAQAPEGATFLIRDSSGHLALCVRGASAARLLGASRGDEATVLGLRYLAKSDAL